jgi:hypothetical protein
VPVRIRISQSLTSLLAGVSLEDRPDQSGQQRVLVCLAQGGMPLLEASVGRQIMQRLRIRKLHLF